VTTARRALPALLGAVLVNGCLDKPGIEERWTRLDVRSSSVTPGQTFQAGTSQPITVRTAITYRHIVTGFAVTELRLSTLSTADVGLDPDAPRLTMAQDIDAILANSVTMGRATRAVTGWDHLIQEVDLTFTGAIPSAAVDSLGRPIGLFLISYLGAGDEVERADGSDTLIVTPFPSTTYEILPVGLELGVTP
jgi:hypothetical protein